MKKPFAQLGAGLVAVKGEAAAPALDTPTRSPASGKPAAPAKPKKETPLNFKMSDDFVISFKTQAAQDRLKLNELLERAFAAYREK